MSDVDQHAEAHRLKEELGYGARRIAQELGITRHAATQLLAQPLGGQPAEPVAERVAEVAAGGRQPAAAVAATDSQDRRPVAELRLPRRMTEPLADPLAVLDDSQQRAVRRDLAVLAQTGCPPDVLLTQAVTAMAYGYRLALQRGQVEVGQPVAVTAMRLRPHAQLADRSAS
ncbi:hypothetical protein [Streptomyces albogriseolus]|uniref:hypothetical protein n=1 Tax=Streptomyces albogriseolus TaxID=1887 RepID=UPI003CF47C1C